jgi:hypothetical protein
VRVSPTDTMILPLLFGTKPAAVEEFEKLRDAYNKAYEKEWLEYCDMPTSDYSSDYAPREWEKMMSYAYDVLYLPVHKENVLYYDLYQKVNEVFSATGQTYGGRCSTAAFLIESLIRDAAYKLEHGTAVYIEEADDAEADAEPVDKVKTE